MTVSILALSVILAQVQPLPQTETTLLPATHPGQGVEPSAALDVFDWMRGGREDVASHGILFNVNLTVDSGYNVTGGTQAGGYVSGLLTATLQLDTEKLLGLKGGRFQVGWQTYCETNPGPYTVVPDYWGYESIASGIGDLNQVSICYYEQKLLDDRLAVRFGKQDSLDVFLNPLGASAYFISNLDTYPATMVAYTPTYPDQAMGLVLVGKPTDWLDLKTSWFDGTNVYTANGEVPRSTGSVGPGSFFDNPGSWFFMLGQSRTASQCRRAVQPQPRTLPPNNAPGHAGWQSAPLQQPSGSW